jgi:hypothetical protein
MKKCLGRCRAGHVTVIDVAEGAMPEGVCKHAHVLIEWAVK